MADEPKKCPKCKQEMWIQNDLAYVNDHPMGVVEVAYCKCGHKRKVS